MYFYVLSFHSIQAASVIIPHCGTTPGETFLGTEVWITASLGDLLVYIRLVIPSIPM